MTHRDGLPRFSALSVRRRDAGHRKTYSTTSESLGSAALRVAYAARRRASKRLDDAPHRRRPFSYPTDRLRDLYESLSVTFGISRRSTDSLFPSRKLFYDHHLKRDSCAASPARHVRTLPIRAAVFLSDEHPIGGQYRTLITAASYHFNYTERSSFNPETNDVMPFVVEVE